MAKTILVIGYGPGISNAVAEKFGSSGFAVGLVARNQDKLVAGVKALEGKGVRAAAFPGDASDPASLRAAVAKAHATLGPIAVLHWNAAGGVEIGDLLTVDARSIGKLFDVGIVGLVTAVQEALPDLKANEGAVLITNGAFGELAPQMDELAVNAKAMGLGLANAAKHKLAGLLAARLKGEGVYVGEVMVAGTVKGTAWDRGAATLEAAAIASKFWDMYKGRSEVRGRVS